MFWVRNKKINFSLRSYLEGVDKGVHALRGFFGPLWSQNLKVAFHKFLLIGLLEEKLECKILAFKF